MTRFGIPLLLVAVTGFVGCSKTSEPTANTSTRAEDDLRHDHK